MRDGSLKQSLRLGRHHQTQDADAAGRFAEDGDALGIAAEGRDIAFDPAKTFDLVEQAVVARNLGVRFLAERRMRQETEKAQTIIDRDDHTAQPGERFAVVDRLGGGSDDEAAAMNPVENGELFGFVLGRRPDVDEQAIFAKGRVDRHLRDAGKERGHLLRARGAKLEAVANALPRGHRLRRLPAKLADGRGGIGNSLVSMDILLVADRQPADGAAVDVKLGRRCVTG